MPYVTSIERLALKEGYQKGTQETWLAAIAMGLEVRFGAAGKKLLPKIQTVQDVKKLQALNRAIHSGKTLAEVKQLLD